MIDNKQKKDKSNKKQLGNILPILPIDQMVDVVMESSNPMRDIGVMDEVVDKNKVLILPALEKVGGGGENIKAKKPQQP